MEFPWKSPIFMGILIPMHTFHSVSTQNLPIFFAIIDIRGTAFTEYCFGHLTLVTDVVI